MEINTNIVRLPAAPAAGTERSRTAPQTPLQAGFEATDSLNSALRTAPEVRQEEIQRATRLVETGNYPPPEIINRLARLLADELSSTAGRP